jgi:outer membrane protein OmpU
MNKLMLGAAAVALTLAVSPAFAADDSGVKLGLGGHFKGYVNYSNEDDIHSVDLLRETEVHFGGETTLDNGLTVGAHIEASADGLDGFDTDESYVYMAGSWGRVNVGEEDGAAYLLQVAAPSADDNIDGLRQFIAPSNIEGTLALLGAGFGINVGRDYANDLAKDADKLTYLSPVFSGFQAGLSYTPENTSATAGGNRAAVAGTLGNAFAPSDVIEGAVRYEGMVGTVGLIAGAGYTTAGDSGIDEWNVGVDLDIGAFGLGAAYTNLDVDNVADVDTMVFGADYTTGPFKLGASYLNADATGDEEFDRYAAGVTYSYGPGMTFRGSVGYRDAESATFGDSDATTVTVGTQVNF